jgi:hypothetical protein
MELSILAALANIGSFVLDVWSNIKRSKIKSAMLGVLCLGIMFFGIYYLTLPNEPPTPRTIITDWGSMAVVKWEHGVAKFSGPKQSALTVNGSLLRSLARKNYKLIGVCFHYLAPVDVLDQPNISKSGLYDITDHLITITIPWNEQFISELVHATPVNETQYLIPIPQYSILAVPKGVTPESFTTLRQAIAFGAKRLQSVAGPL